MSPQIREAQPDDAVRLSELYEELGYPTPIDHIAHSLHNPPTGTFTFVACKDERVLGVMELLLMYHTYRPEPAMQVSALVVDSRERSKGIGEALMQHALHFAQSNHCCRLELVSNVKRQQAHKFYRKIGFSSDTHLYFKKPL